MKPRGHLGAVFQERDPRLARGDCAGASTGLAALRSVALMPSQGSFARRASGRAGCTHAASTGVLGHTPSGKS